MSVTHPIPQLSLRRQLDAIRPEIEAAWADILDNTAFIGGRRVQDFEADFARYCGAEHCIGVGNGTDALQGILHALDLAPGDEVIVPAMSFIATLEPLTTLGLKPVLADIDPVTCNLDPAQAEKALTGKTRALLPVHLYGQPADMDALNRLAQKKGLMVIEDSAQAHGAVYKGQRTGSLGHAAGFSFYPGKNLGAFGDGGAVTTSDPELADRLRKYCDHGRLDKYKHGFPGINSRLDALQAAVLHVKLRHLDGWNNARQRWASLYTELLQGIDALILPETGPDRTHVWHQYVIRTPERDRLQAHLQEKGITSGLHYPIALHLQPAYRDLGYGTGDFPHAEALGETCLSLPMFAELTEAEVRTVADAIRAFFGQQ